MSGNYRWQIPRSPQIAKGTSHVIPVKASPTVERTYDLVSYITKTQRSIYDVISQIYKTQRSTHSVQSYIYKVQTHSVDALIKKTFTPAPNQYWDWAAGTGSLLGSGGTNEARAQGFTPSANISPDNIQVVLAKLSTPTDNVVVTITSSTPDGTVLATSNPINGSTLTTTHEWKTFEFPSPPSLTSGSLYYLVVSRTGARDITNRYSILLTVGDVYPGGAGYQLDTGVWLLSGSDLGFRVPGAGSVVTSLIKKTQTKTSSVDSLIKKTFTIASSIDSLLSQTQTLTNTSSVDSLIKKTQTSTSSVDSLILKTRTDTFPVVAGTNTGALTTAATSFSPTRDASPTAFELELLIIGWGTTGQTNPLGTPPSGWTSIIWDERTSGSTEGLAVYYRTTDGTENTSIGSWADLVSTKLAWEYYRIDGAANAAIVPPQGATAQGALASVNPPALTPSFSKRATLWIAIGASGSITAFSGDPTNYTNAVDSNSGVAGSAATNVVLRSTRRELYTDSEDPTTYTNAASSSWVAQTIAIPSVFMSAVDAQLANRYTITSSIDSLIQKTQTINSSVDSQIVLRKKVVALRTKNASQAGQSGSGNGTTRNVTIGALTAGQTILYQLNWEGLSSTPFTASITSSDFPFTLTKIHEYGILNGDNIYRYSAVFAVRIEYNVRSGSVVEFTTTASTDNWVAFNITFDSIATPELLIRRYVDFHIENTDVATVAFDAAGDVSKNVGFISVFTGTDTSMVFTGTNWSNLTAITNTGESRGDLAWGINNNYAETVNYNAVAPVYAIGTLLEFQNQYLEVQSLVVKTQTKTHSVDSLIKKTQTNTSSVDSLLKKTQTQTCSVDSLIQKTQTSASSVDAYLVNRRTKTHSVSADIAKHLITARETLYYNFDGGTHGASINAGDIGSGTTFDRINDVTGARLYDNTQFISSPNSGKYDGANQNEWSGVRFYGQDTYGRVYFRYASGFTARAHVLQLKQYDVTGGATTFNLRINASTTNKLDWRNGTVIGTATYSPDTWYRCEFKVASNGDVTFNTYLQHSTTLIESIGELGVNIGFNPIMPDAICFGSQGTVGEFVYLDSINLNNIEFPGPYTKTLTHSVDSLILKTQAVTHSVDALLSLVAATYSLTHSVDSLSLKTQTQQSSVDALLQKTLTIICSVDALISRRQTQTSSVDALIKKTQTSTHSIDALLKKRLTKTHSVDALKLQTRTVIRIAAADTANFNVGDVLWGGSGFGEELAQSFTSTNAGKVTSVELLLSKVLSPTDNIVMAIRSTLTGPDLASVSRAASSLVSTGTNIKEWATFTLATPFTLTANTTYYIVLYRSGSRDTTNYIVWWYVAQNVYSGGAWQEKNNGVWLEDTALDFAFRVLGLTKVDSLLLKTQTSSSSIDSLILKTQRNTHSVDSLVVRTQTNTSSVDSLIKKTQTINSSVDAFITRTSVVTSAVDALIQKTLTSTCSVDSLISKTRTQTCSVDALILRRQTSTSSVDSLLQKTTTINASVDALLRKAQTSTHSVDSLIQRTQTKTHSVDAALSFAEIVYDDAYAAHGDYSIRFRSWFRNAYVEWNDFGTPTQYYARFYLYLESTPATDNDYIQFISGGVAVGAIGVDSAGKIYVVDNDGNRTTGTMDVATLQWVRIEASIFTDPTSGQIEALLFNAMEGITPSDTVTSSSVDTGSSIDAIRFGINTPSTYGPVWLDDLAINPDEYPGSAVASTATIHDVISYISKRFAVASDVDALIVLTSTKSSSVDCLILKTQTQTSSVDSLLLKTETNTHSVDALIVKTFTVASSVDSLIKKTQTQTCSVDSLLRKTQQSTCSVDALISLTSTKQSSVDALVQKTQRVSSSVDALLRRTETSTCSVDSLIKKTQTQSCSVDALIQRRQRNSSSVDALISKAFTVASSVDSLLRKTQSNQSSVDSLLRKTQSVDSSVDAYIQTAGRSVSSVDALLRRREFSYTDLDSLIVKSGSVASSVDCLIRRTQRVTCSVDSLLRKTTTVASSADGLVSKRQNVSASVDALVRATTLQYHLVDSLIKKTKAVTSSVDALILRQSSLQHSVDTYLGLRTYRSHQIDAYLQTATFPYVAVDGLLKKTTTVASSVDANISTASRAEHEVNALLKKVGRSIYSVDVHLLSIARRQNSVDALLKRVETSASSVDALARLRSTATSSVDLLAIRTSTKTNRVDVLITKTQSKTYSIDANLRSAFAVEHAVDAYLISAQVSSEVDSLVQKTQRVQVGVSATIGYIFEILPEDTAGRPAGRGEPSSGEVISTEPSGGTRSIQTEPSQGDGISTEPSSGTRNIQPEQGGAPGIV